MCPSLRLGVAAVAFAGAVAFSSLASAQDAGPEGGVDAGPPTMTPGAILAYYCGDADMQCMMAPLEFEYTHVLLSNLPEFDTGWIPKNFKELQVKFKLEMPTDTQVRMRGKFQTTWPEPLTIATPGDRFSGFLKIDYGLILEALGKIDVKVLGAHIQWQGPLPYIPQIDFHLLGMQQFDAWAYQPDSVTTGAFTPKVRLFQVNLLGLVGVPKEVAELGVEVDIRGELQATYHTERMVIDPSVVPITTQNGVTLHNFVGGPYVEIDVHPEGWIEYQGFVHLILALYVEILGHSAFNLPFYSYPLPITELLGLDLGRQITFDKVRIHVPLPDIPEFEQPAVVDFGKVAVGSGEKLAIHIPNEGEAKAKAVGEVEPAMSNVFKMLSPVAMIEPGESEEMSIRFTPKKVGKYQATLTIMSNDPDLPEQQVLLKGEAVDPSDPDYPGYDGGVDPSDPDGTGSTYEVGDDGGCGCRAVGNRNTSVPLGLGWFGWLGLLGLAALGVRRGIERGTAGKPTINTRSRMIATKEKV